MNKKNVYIFVLFSWLLTFALLAPVYAVDITGLYEVEVPVFNQAKEERKTAMRRGLLDVLIKISGSSDIPFTPGMPEVLDNAAQYVQQFRYSAWPASRPVPQVPVGEKTPKNILWVSFDKQALNKILQNQGLPIWGRSRPAALIWLAVEDKGKRFLLGNNSDNEMKLLLESESKRRGIPILLPLLDLQDQAAIRVLDVWGDFQEEILQASRRYETKAILSGRLFRDGYEGWLAKFTLYEENERVSWESAGPTQESVFAKAIDNVASRLSARYAQVIDETTEDAFFIIVKNVNNLSDYARLTKYLGSIASVTEASAIRFEANNTTFRLDIKGVELGVVRAIELGNVLVASQEFTSPDIAAQEDTSSDIKDDTTAGLQTDFTETTSSNRVYLLLR